MILQPLLIYPKGDSMYVKANLNPDTGRPYVIRQPERNYRVLPAAGSDVPNNRFYRQHLADKSIVLALVPGISHVAVNVVTTGVTPKGAVK